MTVNSTINGQKLAVISDIPKKLPADGGNADTVGGYGPDAFAPIGHVGSAGDAHALATTSIAGFFSPSEKSKLNGIAAAASKVVNSTTNGNIKINDVEAIVYTHPTTHAATMITEDATHRFATDAEKVAWNAKQTALGFTPENVAQKGKVNGYASLDASGIVPIAQIPGSYFAPSSHVGTGGDSHSVVTQSVAGFMSAVDKKKFDGIAENANKVEQSATNGNVLVNGTQIVVYAHPSTHAATMITEDTTHRFVTDAEKSAWSAKQAALGFTPENTAKKGTSNGYPSLDANGKIPINQIPDIAKQQTYIIKNNTEMNALTGVITGERAFQTDTGDSYIYDGTIWRIMADADWENVNLNWDNIVGKPTATPATIDDAVTTRHAHSNLSVLNAITAPFTTALETKLSGVAANANNYSHPATHPATMITEDTTHRFVTDSEKVIWNAKQAALGYTPLNVASNLSDVNNATTARSNLGLSGDSNTTHYHDSRYYTKNQLNVANGGGAVHWNNVTNAPTSMPANGGNAATVGGLTPSQFLRSDTDAVQLGSLTTFNVNTSKESKFAIGTYVDPNPGTTYALNVSQGTSTDRLYAKESVAVNKFRLEYNPTEDSLDFVYG